MNLGTINTSLPTDNVTESIVTFLPHTGTDITIVLSVLFENSFVMILYTWADKSSTTDGS